MVQTTKQQGFTLTEIITVLAIVGVIAAIATPMLMNSIPNQRLRSTSRDFFSVITQTKSEAIRRGEAVTLLFTPPNLTSAYVMFVDNGAGGGTADNEIVDGAEVRVLTGAPLPNRLSYDTNFGGGDGVTFANNALVFSARGLPTGAGGGLGGGTVQLCTTDVQGNLTDRCRSITVSAAGRINMQ